MCAVFTSQKLETQSSLRSQFTNSRLWETGQKSSTLYLRLLTPKSANNSCTSNLWNQARTFAFAARLRMQQCTKSIFIHLRFHVWEVSQSDQQQCCSFWTRQWFTHEWDCPWFWRRRRVTEHSFHPRDLRWCFSTRRHFKLHQRPP